MKKEVKPSTVHFAGIIFTRRRAYVPEVVRWGSTAA